MIDEIKEAELLAAIDTSVRLAERKLALVDYDPEVDEDAYYDAQEAIFHCEVCTVREVMEVIWPSVEKYIDWLRAQIPVGV